MENGPQKAWGIQSNVLLLRPHHALPTIDNYAIIQLFPENVCVN